jgi:hypothetical protein
MAGLVLAICSGRLPRPMAGTSLAMTVKVTRKANRGSCLTLGSSPRACSAISVVVPNLTEIVISARNDRALTQFPWPAQLLVLPGHAAL